jgi:DNA-binding PadR family transcriptional regulator
MPRHHRHRNDGIPPIPPVPPIPPGACGNFRFRDFAEMFAMGGRGFGGNWGPFHFEFGEGPGGRGRHRGGRGRRRMFESGELRLLLLKLIADDPRHGYDLIRAIEDMTGGEYAPSPGIVYPTLTMLQDMGLIEEAEAEGARKPFQITDEGREHLEERSEEAEELIERLEELAPDSRQQAGPAIGRAVKNLMTAMSHRISSEGFDEELLHEIAAILDEAAQRIERVK